MVDDPAYRAFNKIADKWRAFAVKRREHFFELYRSGRWTRYYTEAQFLLRLREVSATVEVWAGIIDPAALDLPEDEAIVPPRRSAA